MAEEGLTEGGTSSPSANTNQMPQAAPPHDSENVMCPICMDAIRDQVSVSWCSHAFCFPCILQWSRSTAVCPICREPFQYLLRNVGDNNYEVYSIGHYISFARHSPRRRAHHRSAGRRRHRSTGRRQHSSSSRDSSTGRASARERERNRTPRQHHSRSQQARGYDSPGSSRQQHSWAEDTSTDTSSDEDQDARSEQDVPVRRGRSERHQRVRQVSSREPRATRSRSRRRSRSPDGHRDS